MNNITISKKEYEDLKKDLEKAKLHYDIISQNTDFLLKQNDELERKLKDLKKLSVFKLIRWKYSK